jgi:hypothetical protein
LGAVGKLLGDSGSFDDIGEDCVRGVIEVNAVARVVAGLDEAVRGGKWRPEVERAGRESFEHFVSRLHQVIELRGVAEISGLSGAEPELHVLTRSQGCDAIVVRELLGERVIARLVVARQIDDDGRGAQRERRCDVLASDGCGAIRRGRVARGLNVKGRVPADCEVHERDAREARGQVRLVARHPGVAGLFGTDAGRRG